MSHVFSPLARVVLDSFREGVVVLDNGGKVLHTNSKAHEAFAELGVDRTCESSELLPKLARLGARIAPLRVGGLKVGEAVFLRDSGPGETTLAERERNAIVQTLDETGWRLAETARKLGISRTTLWRRLKQYGLHRDGRGRWSQPF
ncbi:MAG: helix-turn-helix domain-containing protein [Gemmatimonadales bacterium]